MILRPFDISFECSMYNFLQLEKSFSADLKFSDETRSQGSYQSELKSGQLYSKLCHANFDEFKICGRDSAAF